MSDPRTPRTKWGIPVNMFTGEPITEHQQMMIDGLDASCAALRELLHEVDGTQAGDERFSTRRLAIAATHLEELQLMALAEILRR